MWFRVLKFKEIINGLVIICLLFSVIIISIYCNNNIIEVTAQKRLLPIYSVETSKKEVALTFDCAWGADDIGEITDVLKQNNTKATFFVVGTWVDKYGEQVKMLSEAGHQIGNHSNNHAHVNGLSYDANILDMKKCNEKIENITGDEVMFYRGPYGEYNNIVIKAAEELNMKVIQWDVDTLDYTGKTPDEMCERIRKKIRNGSIILMHNDTEHTAKGLQEIIDEIKTLGYEIVPLEDLIYFDNYEMNHEGRQLKR